MDIIVGSGPSGVATATALLARGRRVHMVDGGYDLEPDRARALGAYRAAGAAAPVPPLLDGSGPADAGRAIKLLFGSDYPFKGAKEHLGLEGDVGLAPSLARGGLSTVWGSVVMPYAEADTADWPIRQAELAPHYAAALALTGQAGERDDLAEILPLYAEPQGALRPSRQIQRLRDNLDRHRAALRAAGVRFGASRVAITPPAAGGCVYCGQCLNGCPQGFIYAATRTLKALQTHPDFSYQPRAIVSRVSEVADGVVIEAKEATSGAALELHGSRVFLAAGVIPTTGILLRSMGAYGHTVEIRDSQAYLMPTALIRGVSDVHKEALYTVTQLFLEISDPTISPFGLHVQAYSYNTIIARTIRAKLGALAGPLEFAARQLDARFLLLQGWIHSDQSGRIGVTAQRGADGGERLILEARPNPTAAKVARAVMGKLLRLAPKTGAIPVPPLLEVTSVGRGFHAGGSFPMRAAPGRFETDVLGRPVGFTRVHAVDATILPSIASTSVTLPVMANAHRIATVAPE